MRAWHVCVRVRYMFDTSTLAIFPCLCFPGCILGGLVFFLYLWPLLWALHTQGIDWSYATVCSIHLDHDLYIIDIYKWLWSIVRQFGGFQFLINSSKMPNHLPVLYSIRPHRRTYKKRVILAAQPPTSSISSLLSTNFNQSIHLF